MWIMERRAESRSGICHMGRLAKNSRFLDRLGALLPRCPLWVKSGHLSGRQRCPLLALSGHLRPLGKCPLSGVKRTYLTHVPMSACDPTSVEMLVKWGFAVHSQE